MATIVESRAEASRADERPAPVRQLSRLRAEIAASAVALSLELFGGRKLPLLYGIVALRCLPDWVRSGELVRPAAVTRSIASRQIAASLALSPETTRRHMTDLRDLGLVMATEAGFALPVDAEGEAFVRTYFLRHHDLFVRLCEDFGATCDHDFVVGRDFAFGVDDAFEALSATLMPPVDAFKLPGITLGAQEMWSALTAVAIIDVTYDPVLARRYADSIPPDDLRRAVSLRRLAAALQIPYATAWRQLQELDRLSLVSRVGDDWTVLTRNLQGAAQRRLSSGPSVRLHNMLREIARRGLDPAQAGRHYRLGRPRRADFGIRRRD